MTASTTMTIRVTAETKERLGQLARETRRSRSFLARFIQRGPESGLANVA